MTFIFSGCHTFFGDPCVPAARHFGPNGARNQRSCDR
jgi:hypothetical protein